MQHPSDPPRPPVQEPPPPQPIPPQPEPDDDMTTMTTREDGQGHAQRKQLGLVLGQKGSRLGNGVTASSMHGLRRQVGVMRDGNARARSFVPLSGECLAENF